MKQKVINFELSKRLNEARLLDDIQTEYGYYKFSIDDIRGENIIIEKGICTREEIKEKYNNYLNLNIENPGYSEFIKTLSLDESIEFIPKYIKSSKLIIEAMGSGYIIKYDTPLLFKVGGFTLLEAIEKMLEYLFNNNLLELGATYMKKEN